MDEDFDEPRLQNGDLATNSGQMDESNSSKFYLVARLKMEEIEETTLKTFVVHKGVQKKASAMEENIIRSIIAKEQNISPTESSSITRIDRIPPSTSSRNQQEPESTVSPTSETALSTKRLLEIHHDHCYFAPVYRRITYDEYGTHLAEYDTRERAFQCNVCGKRVLSKEILICHIERKHPEEKPFECPMCFCMFRSRSELIAHKRENMHFGKKSSIKDDRQEEEASRSASRLEHTNVHLRNDTRERAFPCKVCGKRLLSKEILICHIERKHPEEKPFECPVCSCMFRHRNELMDHKQENKHFSKKSIKDDRSGHVDAHNPEIRKCDICNKEFKKRRYLELHKRIHTDVRPFECRMCNKTFTTKDILSRHIRVHTGEKPFECRECKKQFSSHWNFTRHMLTHTREKLFKCSQCQEEFTQNEDLTRHMLRHSGGKLFQCHLCEKVFVNQDKLTRHVRKETIRLEKLNKCDVRGMENHQEKSSSGEDEASLLNDEQVNEEPVDDNGEPDRISAASKKPVLEREEEDSSSDQHRKSFNDCIRRVSNEQGQAKTEKEGNDHEKEPLAQELKLLEIDASSLPSSPHQDAEDQMPSTTAENASYMPSGCSEATATSNTTAATKICTFEHEKPVDSPLLDEEKEIKEEVEDDYFVSERARPEPSSILQKPIEEYSKLIGFENDRGSDAHEYIKGYDLSQELMNGKMGPEKEKELLQALQRFKKNTSLLPSSSNQAEPDSVRLQREDHALLFEVLHEIRRKNALENAAASSKSSGSSRKKRPRKLHEASGAEVPTTRSRKRRCNEEDG